MRAVLLDTMGSWTGVLTWQAAACRFLTNLPPHMQHLNYTLVQTLVPVGLQSVEEIEAIVHQATRPSVWPNWPPQQQAQ